MNKQIKTWLLSIGLAVGLTLAGNSFAAKPKETAAATAAPAASAEAAQAAAAAPVVASAAVAAPAADAHAAEENPYGLSALWAQGDVVAKGTLLILVLMSMGSWYVIVTKLVEQSRNMRHASCRRQLLDCWQRAPRC